MPDVLNPQVLDQGTATNAKMLMDMAQTTMGLTIQNAAANQQHVQTIANSALQNGLTIAQDSVAQGLQMARAVTARTLRHTLDTSAEQATAFAQQISADLQEKVAEMGGALSGVQQFSKVAQSTAPQTGTGGAFGSETGLSQQIALSLANLAASQAAIIELLKNKTG